MMETESESVQRETETIQTATGGSFFSTAAIEPKHLFPSAVERIFNLLDALMEPDQVYERDEKRPSLETIQWAKYVLLRVLPSYYLRTAEIDAFHGEVHVSWERDHKRVVVFVPSKGVLKLYMERTDKSGEVHHILRSIEHPRAINGALCWLFS
jgi:hypothetical protein